MGMNKARYLQDRKNTTLDDRIAFCIYCACMQFYWATSTDTLKDRMFFVNDFDSFYLDDNIDVITHFSLE